MTTIEWKWFLQKIIFCIVALQLINQLSCMKQPKIEFLQFSPGELLFSKKFFFFKKKFKSHLKSICSQSISDIYIFVLSQYYSMYLFWRPVFKTLNTNETWKLKYMKIYYQLSTCLFFFVRHRIFKNSGNLKKVHLINMFLQFSSISKL